MQVFLTGLGAVTPAVTAGTAGPTSPLSTVADKNLFVFIDGVAAKVVFAGLAPTLGGLYQLNVTIPSGVTSGTSVDVEIQTVDADNIQATIPISILQAAAPQIRSLNPVNGQAGNTVALVINGTNLSGVTSVQFSPSTGITVSNVNATATQVTATVTIAASAPTGQVNVTVSSPAGTSNALAFTIQQGPPPNNNYDGHWNGPTSQGRALSLTIASNSITAYSYGVSFPNLGPNCPTGITDTEEPAPPIPITGSSFSADTIGGLAYVLDEKGDFAEKRCNTAAVDLEPVGEDEHMLFTLITRHAETTGSPRAKWILESWEQMLPKFIKIFPHEYRRVLVARALVPAAPALVPVHGGAASEVAHG